MRRVAVTTTADRQSRIAGLVASCGLTPVSMPCIEVTPGSEAALESVREEAARADAVAITSPRTVPIVWPRGMPTTPVWAVGTATAKTVRNAGGRVVHVGSGGAKRMIVTAPPSRDLAVVFPHGADTPDDVLGLLRDRVRRLAEYVVYTTEPLDPGSEAVEAALFLSPSAVDGWASRRLLDDVVVAAIGATTAAALRRHGREPDVMPAQPDVIALVGLLAAAMSAVTDTVAPTLEER